MKPEKNQNKTEYCEQIAELEPLVEKAVAGDGDALRTLCEELGRGVLFRINRILGNSVSAMDVEDISQEVFLRICEKITTLREPKYFRKWLNSIITNETTQFLRGKLKRGTVLDINEYFEDIVDENNDFLPEEYVNDSELREMMIGIISTLPKRQRQAIMYRYYDDLSVTEVAEAMNIKRQVASGYISVAIEKIKTELEKLPTTAIFGLAPALSIESALKDALQADAARYMPTNPDWLQIVLNPCEQYFIAGSALATGAGATTVATTTATTAAATATATSVSAAMIAGVVLTCALLAAPILTSNMEPAEPRQIDMPVMSGDIYFSDGINLGEYYKRINPQYAKLDVNNDIQVIEWWIVNENNEVVLRSNAGNNTEKVQINPNEFESSGMHHIIFKFENELGEAYRMRSNFIIEN